MVADRIEPAVTHPRRWPQTLKEAKPMAGSADGDSDIAAVRIVVNKARARVFATMRLAEKTQKPGWCVPWNIATPLSGATSLRHGDIPLDENKSRRMRD